MKVIALTLMLTTQAFASTESLTLMSSSTRLPINGGEYGDFFDVTVEVDTATSQLSVPLSFRLEGPCGLSGTQTIAPLLGGRGWGFVAVIPGATPGTCRLTVSAPGFPSTAINLEVFGDGTPSEPAPAPEPDPAPVPVPVPVDLDADNDGVLDADDNCVHEYNPDQRDRDNDGVGSECDPAPRDPSN